MNDGSYGWAPSSRNYTAVVDRRQKVGWINLNNNWGGGGQTNTGPWVSKPTITDFGATNSNRGTVFDTPAKSIIKSCQDKAAALGYDHVYMESFIQRHGSQDILSSTCWACLSTSIKLDGSTGCNYWSGGKVPATATCTSTPGNLLRKTYYSSNWNLFNSYEDAGNSTKCGHAGCDGCINPNTRYSFPTFEKVLSVYRRTQTGVSARANIPVYASNYK